ncbi:anti-sigma factor family protein [Marmoricola sp. RAF53]|uniref:anti-sigma factor family protein n=1 Tax=Marmoricola sp. RAF53 TaxID=3233059 RepID=UPI003F983D8E
MTCEYRYDDAAYVLGALTPAERASFQEHLDGCAACTRAVQEMAGLPGLLGRISPDVLTDPGQEVPVPATLLPALVRRVHQERRRRTWAVAGAAAAVLAVVAGGAVAVTHALDDPNPPARTVAAGRPMQVLADHGMTARLALTPVAWGTRMDLACSYAASTYPGNGHHESYAMVVRTRGGGTEQVATWRALPGRTMHLSAATAAGRVEISSVEIRGADGTPVLRLTP